MKYLGDFAEDATVYIPFNTFSSDDPSASVTITNLVAADIKVHKDGAVAEIVTDGASVSIDFDGVTGNHLITIDTSAHADYAIGSDYLVRMEGTTVDGGTINAWVGHFSIENRFIRVDEIANDAITAASINTGALTADAYAADALVAATFATGAFTADAFAADALVAATFATGAFTADAFAADALVAATFATNSLTADALAADAVTEIQSGLATAANLQTVDDNVDLILVDTGTTLDGKIDTISTNSTNIETDTQDIQSRLPAALAGGLMASDAQAISGDTVAADNAEATYDGTGYADSNAPATQEQVSNIGASSGGAMFFANEADNIDSAIKTIAFDGVETSGTNASVSAEDASYHQIDDTANNIDIVYQFDIGNNRTATEVIWRGGLTGGNDSATVQAYNGSGWDTIGVIDGTAVAPTAVSANQSRSYPLLSSHTGTGSDLGLIFIRIECAAQSNPALYTDQLLVAGVAIETGIPNGSSITLAASTTNTNLVGNNWTLALGGQDISGSYIKGATVTGIASGTTDVTFEDCIIGAATIPPGVYKKCGIGEADGTFTAASDGDYYFHECFSAVAGSGTPDFAFGGLGAATTINNRGWTGGSAYVTDSDVTMSHEVLAGGGTSITPAGADIEVRGTCRSLTFTLADTDLLNTIQFIGVTGPISVTAGGTLDTATVNLYGISSSVTDTSNSTVNDNTISQPNINIEADTALSDINLDHLLAVADADDVVNDSVIGKMAASDGDWSGFDKTADSLEAIRDRGDAAWTTGAGGTPPQLLQSTTIATLASQTSFTLTAGSADDDAYNDAIAVVTDSATSTQKAVGTVSDYTGASKTVTLSADPGIFTMAVGDTIEIIAALGAAGSTPTAAQIVDEWESQSQADPTGFHVNVMEVNGTAQTANDIGADVQTMLDDYLLFTTTISLYASQSLFRLTAGPAQSTQLDNMVCRIVDADDSSKYAYGICSAYSGSTKQVLLKEEISSSIFTMAVGDTVEFYAPLAGAPSDELIADTVWSEPLSNQTNFATMGGVLWQKNAILLSASIDTVTSQTELILNTGAGNDDAYNGCYAIIRSSTASASNTAVVKITDHIASTDTIHLESAPNFTIGISYLVQILAPQSPFADEIVDEFETQSQADPTGFHVNVLEVNGTAQTANDNGADINEILTDTGTTIPATLSTMEGKIDTVDGIVDNILVDTNELQTDDVPSLIAAQNDLSAAEVNAEVDTAIETYHLDHLLAANYDPAAKPGVATALLNELVESDVGVSRFTANALEQAPGTTAADVADAVWDEAQADHVAAGSMGLIASETADILVDTGTTLPGTLTTIEGKIDTVDANVDLTLADTNELQGDWANGGRLDLLLDAILEDTGTDGVKISATTANEIADAILNRDFSAVSDTNARTALNALRFLRNKWSISGSTLTVTAEDDSTAKWTATVSTDAAADPVTGTTRRDMAGGFRSAQFPLGIAAPQPASGVRSMLAFWMGGASAGEVVVTPVEEKLGGPRDGAHKELLLREDEEILIFLAAWSKMQ